MLVLLLLLILLILVDYVVRKSKSSILPNWPLVGMVPSLLWHVSRNLLHQLVTQVLKQEGGSFLFKGPIFTDLNFFITSDPGNVHHIFSRNFANYPKGAELKEIMEPLGDGIFNADGNSWKTQREMIHSLITTSKFEQLMLDTLRRKLDSALIPILHNASSSSSKTLDLQDLMKRFTFDTICQLVLGFDPEYLSLELPYLDYAEAFDVIEEVIVYRHCVPLCVWKLQKWVGIGEEAKMKKASECFGRFLDGRIQVKKEEQGRFDDDFLTQLISGTERIGESDDFLKDAAFNLIVAGRDTIAAALTWFFWLVAINPVVEQNILEEMHRVIPATDRSSSSVIIPSMEELNRLVYLHGAICETLRLYPSVPFEHKKSLKADVLPSGHAISSNTKILMSLYSMGRMEEIWGEDCMEFKPERWVSHKEDQDGGKIVYVPSYKFPAFLAGPRTCLGRKIAFTQMKVIACCVLQKFKIEVVEGHPVVPVPAILMFMTYGLKIRVSQRTLPTTAFTL